MRVDLIATQPHCSCDGCDKPRYVRGLCRTHYDRFMRTGLTELRPPMDSLRARLIKGLNPSEVDSCWVWDGLQVKGYGLIWDGRKKGLSKTHRVAYELWVGPLDDDLQVHHRCENKSCCNPTHLELVTPKQHSAEHRITHCVNGHEYTAENTYDRPPSISSTGQRICRTCASEADRKWKKNNRDEANARKRARRKEISHGRSDGVKCGWTL